MMVVGLTGSIGMGKSTTAAMFKAQGIPICDADAEVHRLYAGPAAQLIEEQFPGTTTNGQVDRSRLAQTLASDEQKWRQLEAIVHPLVYAAQRKFLDDAQAAGHAVAILESPLLFEGGLEKHFDAVVVVSASANTQRQRVLARPGMTQARLDSILARQTPNDEKRRLANFIVDTNQSIEDCHVQVASIILRLQAQSGTAFEKYWHS